MRDLETSSDRSTLPAAELGGNTRVRPRPAVMTLGLIAMNIVMSLAQFAAGGFRGSAGSIGIEVADWALGAKVPSLIAHGEYWRLVTANFLHASWAHLFWNSIGLLAVGRLIEAFYGPLRLATIYVLAAVAGAIASYFGTPAVSLGASTGVMGLMGALMLHNLRYRRHLPERVNNIYPILVLVIVVEFWMDQQNNRVDLFGHLGGFVGGWVMAMLFEGRIAGPDHGERDWLPLPTAFATVLALLCYGALGLLVALPSQVDLMQAAHSREPLRQAQLLEQALRQRPYFVEARLQLAEVLVGLGRDDDAAGHYQLALQDRKTAGYVRQRFEALARRYLRRAVRQYSMELWFDAAESYRRAIVYARDDRLKTEVNNGYAWLLVDKLGRDLEIAEKHALVAVRTSPTDAASLDTLAWVYFKQRRYQEALDPQEKAVRIAESERKIAAGEIGGMCYRLGAMYEKANRRQDAIRSYARALRYRVVYPEASEALRRLSGQRALPQKPSDDPGMDPAVQRGIV